MTSAGYRARVPDASHVLDLPGLDVGRLRQCLRDRGLPSQVTAAELVPGGRSNLTYFLQVRDGADVRHWVLRRPPLGHVLQSAHDMGREHTVQSALAGTAVPVPSMVALCEDVTVLGSPFYLMDRVPGRVVRSREDAVAVGAPGLEQAGYALVDVLAALHALNPGEVGLTDFGRAHGYLGRQVRRWVQQLERSRSRDLTGMDELAAALAGTVPAESGAPHRQGIVHGDYRLDNAILHPERPQVLAVLDWEMATLGDPLADVGLLLTYAGGLGGRTNPIAESMSPALGWPRSPDLVHRYADAAGLDESDLQALAWCTALGHFKLAVILEGIHYRYSQGQTVGSGFDTIGVMVEPLVAGGLRALDPHP